MIAFVNRAFTHSSNLRLVREELERLEKVLVNNGFPRSYIQEVIAKNMSAWHT